MKKQIRISISQDELTSIPCKAIEAFLMGKLSAAGIPVEGIILFGGVSTGRLTCWESLSDKKVNYLWEYDA